VKQLRTELAEAKQTIQQIAGKLTAQDRQQLEYTQRQQYAQKQSLLSIVQQFRGQQDENGQLQYPHFDALMPQIGAIMQTDPRLRAMPDGPEKIAKAYQKVVQGDEELSKPIFEAQLAKRLQAERKQADAQRAKQVTRVKPAGGAPAQQVKSNSIDDAIAASFLRHGF
jgi:quinol monooxygenase YgiN